MRVAGHDRACFVLLVEAQSYAGDRLEERLCDYCVQVMRTHRLPVAVLFAVVRRMPVWCTARGRGGRTALQLA
jgi:hypothetical protein